MTDAWEEQRRGQVSVESEVMGSERNSTESEVMRSERGLGTRP